jgi:excisionase family DNA binding protein
MTAKKDKRLRKKSNRVRGGLVGYSVERAGELLGISRSSAYAAVRSGDIPSTKVGSLFIVPAEAFHAKFGALPEGAAAA